MKIRNKRNLERIEDQEACEVAVKIHRPSGLNINLAKNFICELPGIHSEKGKNHDQLDYLHSPSREIRSSV